LGGLIFFHCFDFVVGCGGGEELFLCCFVFAMLGIKPWQVLYH
jgi:hypothetical protein